MFVAVHPRRWRALLPAVALLVGAVFVLAGSPVSPAQAQSPPCESSARTEGAFRSVPKPALLPGGLRAHAVEPADPRVVYLADATRVVGSRDAGCTWKLVLEIPATPSTAISELTVPDTLAPSGRLLVVATTLSSDRTDAFGALSTVYSRRGAGQPFRQSAPVPGRVRPAVSPGDPDVVYLSTTDQSQLAIAPQRSSDGGATFTPARGTRTYPLPNGASADGAAQHIAVDLDNRNALLVGSLSLQRSTDGGDSFAVALGQPDVRAAHALAAHGRGGDSVGAVVLAATGSSTTGLSENTARIWSVPRTGKPRALPTVGLAGLPQSLAAGQDRDELVLTVADRPPGQSDGYDGTGALYLFDAQQLSWVDVLDRRGYPLLDARLDRSADPAVHLHSSSLSTPSGADEYVVYSPPARGRVVPPTVDDGSGAAGTLPTGEFPRPPAACASAAVFAPPSARPSASRLTPAQARLPVGSDGTARHALRLDLSGDASAVDLIILLDTSDSMGPAASGIACGLEELVTGLAQDGVDLRVGLAEFWDAAPGARYQRLVQVGPAGEPLQRALRSVQTRGGEETHRTALVQAVTGRGLVVDGQQMVSPGQGMSLREGALKVVLHVTDEPWTATTTGEPSPLEVIDTLVQADVRHVGLQVLQNSQLASGDDRADGLAGQTLLRAQLDQFSSGTGAFAPAGGVDCDADGAPDVREGDPLVCTGKVTNGIVPDVGSAVRSLVDALATRGSITIRPQESNDVAVEVLTRFDDVDLRLAGRYDFPLRVRCTASAAGPVTVALRAFAGPVVVRTAQAVVLCPSSRTALAAPAALDAPTKAAPGGQAGPAGPDGPAAAAAVLPPVPPPPLVQVPAPAAAGAAAAAGASAGAAGSAGAGAAGSSAAAQGGAGLALAPNANARNAMQVGVSATGADLPLAAVPLGAGILTTAALTLHQLALHQLTLRRRRTELRTARSAPYRT